MLPLRWIGERSYGIYLWHLPVVAFMPQTMLAPQPLVRAGVQLALIILLSALSWALENPIRRHGLSVRWVSADLMWSWLQPSWALRAHPL